jgi:chemotaxis methyl-accepting protein methylase
MATDARVSYRVHDIFQPWSGPAPNIIKVANLLRRLYFDDARIVSALRSLLASLQDGGHLLIVDNPRMKNTPPRGGLYRRDGDRFVPVAQTVGTPEIDDLIRTVSLDSAPG